MNDGEDRLIGGEALQHDTVERADTALRPERLADFIGQGGGRANLETFIAAARDRGDAMGEPPCALIRRTTGRSVATDGPIG